MQYLLATVFCFGFGVAGILLLDILDIKIGGYVLKNPIAKFFLGIVIISIAGVIFIFVGGACLLPMILFVKGLVVWGAIAWVVFALASLFLSIKINRQELTGFAIGVIKMLLGPIVIMLIGVACLIVGAIMAYPILTILFL